MTGRDESYTRTIRNACARLALRGSSQSRHQMRYPRRRRDDVGDRAECAAAAPKIMTLEFVDRWQLAGQSDTFPVSRPQLAGYFFSSPGDDDGALTQFACTACGKTLKSPKPIEEGKKIKCPHCADIRGEQQRRAAPRRSGGDFSTRPPRASPLAQKNARAPAASPCGPPASASPSSSPS